MPSTKFYYFVLFHKIFHLNEIFFVVIIRQVWFWFLNFNFDYILKITTQCKNFDSEHIVLSLKIYFKIYMKTLNFD